MAFEEAARLAGKMTVEQLHAMRHLRSAMHMAGEEGLKEAFYALNKGNKACPNPAMLKENEAYMEAYVMPWPEVIDTAFKIILQLRRDQGLEVE